MEIFEFAQPNRITVVVVISNTILNYGMEKMK